MKSTRNGTPSFVIPTPLLADELTPLIERLNRELDGDGENPQGAIAAISRRAALVLEDVTAESIPRRLSSIRSGGSMRTSTEIADALLLALEVKIEETDLPTFPGTHEGALEMVNVWAPELDPLEAHRVARQMYRFCEGFLLGCSVDADKLAELEAVKTICKFLRVTTKAPELELVA